MTREFEVSRVYKDMLSGERAGKHIFVLEGGGRSTKTSSIIQYIDTQIFKHENANRPLEVLILRDTLMSAKSSVIKDFFKINTIYGVPISPEINVDRARQSYNIYESNILFGGADKSTKFLGTEYDIIWLNEAIQISYDVYRNLMDRCRMFMILDYNPNATEHWIYDKVIPSPSCCFIHSTQLDNPFLDENIRKSILSSEPTPANIASGTADELHWKVFGLGERAELKGLIYSNVNYIDAFPDNCKWVAYGLDFGFTQSPTALVKVGLKDGELYIQELLYETGLTNLPPIIGGLPDANHTTNILYHLKRLNIPKSAEIIADSAEQKSISELSGSGYNVLKADKPSGSVNEGISILQRYKLNVTKDSVNLKKEYANYKWRTSEMSANWTQYDNKLKNQPVDAYNHGMDAKRYVALKKLAGVQRKIKSTLVGY